MLSELKTEQFLSTSGMCQKFYFPQRSMRCHIPGIEFDVYEFKRFSHSKYARKIFHRLQTQIKQEPQIYWFSIAAAFHNDTKLISIYFTTQNEQLHGSAREAVCRRQRNRMIINKIVLKLFAVFLRYITSMEDPIPNGKGKMWGVSEGCLQWKICFSLRMWKSTRVNKVQHAARLSALYGILRIKLFSNKKTACLSTEKSFSWFILTPGL